MKKKKNIIIMAVMIVLIAIIAIILVRINNSNVSKKEDKDIKPGTEAVNTNSGTQTVDDSTTDKSGIEEFALLVLTAALISLIKEHVPTPLW